MEASNQLSILLVTDSKDYTESLGERIRSHYPSFSLASNETETLNVLERQPVDLMILGFESVQKNEVFYLHLLRARRDIDQRVRYLMLLATKQDVQTAYDSCAKNIFNDYYLACPMYDSNYILIRLREIERLLNQQQPPTHLPLDEVERYLEQMLTSTERLGALNTETEERIQETVREAMSHLREQLDAQSPVPVLRPDTLHCKALPAPKPDTTAPQPGTPPSTQTPVASRTPGLSSRSESLIEQLAEDDNQSRMDQIAPGNPQPDHGVLIIEDEMKQLSYVNELLARQGLVTYPVQTGCEALKHMAKWQPSIVLVDLTLPDISALHVISRISNHPDLKHTRVIAMANQDEREIVLEAARTGIKQVVLKPVDKNLLTQRIQNNLKEIERQNEPV